MERVIMNQKLIKKTTLTYKIYLRCSNHGHKSSRINQNVLDRLVYMSPEVTSVSMTYFPYMEGTKLGKGGLCH